MDRDRDHARKMWAELSPKKKREYFWHYYRIHVFIGLFVTFLVAITVHDCVTRVDPDITIFYVDTELRTEDLTQLEVTLSALIEDLNGDGKSVVSIQQVVNEQKLFVTFAAGDVHLLFIRQEEFLRYAENGAFRPLEPLLEELGITLDVQAYPEIRLTPQEEQEQHIYGIPLEQNAVFTPFGATMADTYLAIPAKGMFSTSEDDLTRYANIIAIVKEILAHSAQAK